MDTKAERRERAIRRIKEVLEEENCTIETSMTIVGKQIVDTQVLITALPDKEPEVVEADPVETEGGTNQ